jgi:ribosomal protein S8
MDMTNGVDGCCSTNLLHHLDNITNADVLEYLGSSYQDGTKMIIAITADYQKKAVGVLKSCGFKNSRRMVNKEHTDNIYGITLWYRSTRPAAKKKAKRRK